MPEQNTTPKVRVNLKYYLMSTAEILDAFRTIPRLLVAGYAYLVWYAVNWFMSLPDPSSQASFLISTIVGGAAAVFGLYCNSGASWSRKTANKEDWIEPADPRHFPRYPRREPRRRDPIVEMDVNVQDPDDFQFDVPARKRGRRNVEQDARELPPEDWFDEEG